MFRYLIFIVTIFAICSCENSPSGYTYKAWDFENRQSSPANNVPGPLGDPADKSGILPEAKKEDSLPEPATVQKPAVKVAILLPLSGKHAKLGQSMLQAAQMALFDIQHENFELMPRDTYGTPDGASKAARSALSDGAQLILGPLFSASARAVKDVIDHTNVNLIAFSTDWTLASPNSFVMGFVPFDQVERIMRYAHDMGLNDIGVLAPDNAYGRMVLSSAQGIAPQINVHISSAQKFSPQLSGIGDLVSDFTRYEDNAKPSYKAVLLPVGGNTASSLSGLMSKYGMLPSKVMRLGTGLMDDPGLVNEPNLFGAKFAAPSPTLRENFENRYRSIYGENPPRLSTLAYDATALASVLAQRARRLENVQGIFNSQAIMNANGFSGIDGIFRFRPNGVAERGLAVLEFRNGRVRIVEDAPKTFQSYRDF